VAIRSRLMMNGVSKCWLMRWVCEWEVGWELGSGSGSGLAWAEEKSQLFAREGTINHLHLRRQSINPSFQRLDYNNIHILPAPLCFADWAFFWVFTFAFFCFFLFSRACQCYFIWLNVTFLIIGLFLFDFPVEKIKKKAKKGVKRKKPIGKTKWRR
jgi:hypothetical protein